MILTLFFYFLIFLVGCSEKNKNKAILYSSILIALYLGLRYDFMYDYKAYYNYFYEAWNLPFNSTSHMEIGWYYLNRFFHPVGFFGFVFITSCLFAYGVYLVLNDYVEKKYVLFTILGFVTTSSFSVLSSAQRQMFVASLFLIAFHFLIKGRISTIKDLINPRTLIYFAIIYLCSYFHGSALFLFIVPLIYLIPQKSIIVPIVLVSLAAYELLFGEELFQLFMLKVIDEGSSYEFLMNVDRDFDTVSSLGMIMYVIQFVIIICVYYFCDLSKEQQICLLLYFIVVFFFASINFSFQIFRLAFYFNIFTYISIGIILSKIKIPIQRIGVGLVYFVWCVQNALFIFDVKPGSVEEYKTIFSAMLG